MSILGLFNQIKERQKVADTELDLIAPITRSGFAMLKREAGEEVKKLKSELKEALFENSVGFFVYGPTRKAEEYGALAKEVAKAAVVNYDGFYHRLAEAVYPTLSGDMQFTTSNYSHLITEIKYIMEEMGVVSLDAPTPPERYSVCRTKEDLMAYLKDVMKPVGGFELNHSYFKLSVLNDSLTTGIFDNLQGVVVLNSDPSEFDTLAAKFKKGAFQIHLTADSVLTEQEVLEFLRSSVKSLEAPKTKKVTKTTKVKE